MTDRRSEIGPNENLRLSESEREYLETGEIPGTYSKQNIESCVRDRFQKLPARIDILAEDVELLDETSRETIPFEDWRECWFEVIDSDNEPVKQGVEEAYSYSPSDETQYPTSGLVEFGETLGWLANSLYLAKNKDEIYEGYLDIILGFVNGIHQMEDGTGSGEHRKKVIDHVTRGLAERSVTLAQIDDATAEDKDEYFENKKKAERIIGEILDEERIQPTPAPIWVLEKAKEKHVRASEFDPRKMQVAGDVPVVDEFTTETVLEIVEEEKLCEKGAVFEMIFEEDFERLIDTHWLGVEAAEIIDLIFQNKKGIMNLYEINDKLSSQADYRKQIPKLTADLSGRESPWDERPLLQESRNGWMLTNYGKAVADSFAKRTEFLGDKKPLPGFPSEDLLEAAFEGLDLST